MVFDGMGVDMLRHNLPQDSFLRSNMRKLKPHKKVSDFIGNYLACAIGDKMIRYRTHTSSEPYSYKGHHAGLTKEEMIVPLIILE